MKKVKGLVPRALAVKMAAVFIVVVVASVIMRSQIIAATAVNVEFLECVPSSNRLLATGFGQKLTFKVKPESNTTLEIPAVNFKQELEADKLQRVSVELPKKSDWYAYKLSNCDNVGYIGVMKENGEMPPSLGHQPHHEGYAPPAEGAAGSHAGHEGH